MVAAISTAVSAGPCFAGADVSKLRLDVCLGGRCFCVANTAAGVRGLLSRLNRRTPALTVVEATGGYERRLVQGLRHAALPVAVVNPLRVRRFAQARGVQAKTDTLDAAVLADFARLNADTLRPLPALTPADKTAAMLKELSARRRQLLCQIQMNKNQLEHACLAIVKKSIRTVVAQLQQQMLLIEAQIQKQIDADPQLAARCRALRQVKGVGPRVALVLVSELPELGVIDRRKIAALVGVAPFNDDSGPRSGERHIAGGRAHVRSALYMATLVGVRHDPILRDYYHHLLGNGKAKKVALVACMRKRLNHLSGLLRPEKLQPPA